MSRPLNSLFSLGLASVMTVAACGAAFALPDTRTMTCRQAQDLVNRSGAIVLSTGKYTYDRYISARGYCDVPYGPDLAYVPTRDNPNCPVGYRCVQQSPMDLNN